MGKRKILLILLITWVTLVAPAYTQTPAKALTPVKSLTMGYSAADADRLRGQYNVGSFVTADDAGTYMFTHLSEFLPTSIVQRSGVVSVLEKQVMPEIEEVKSTTCLGTLTLREAMDDERSRLQGIVVVHKGRIVFEEYPGMRENDLHLWMSSSKTVTSLLVHQLEEEGRLDVSKSITTYLKEFAGTDWDRVRVVDLLNMASGMDLVESAETLKDPDSPVSRAFRAALVNRGQTGERESIKDIMMTVKASGEPGIAFEYSTYNTQVLGLLVERITGKPFADVFSERIWSRVGMEGDGLLALTPSGESLNGGIFASRLRDMARFAMLFTPSWHVVSREKIVSDSLLKKIQTEGWPEAYLKGHQGPRFTKMFGESPVHNAYQWDAVFSDGDFYKAGRNGQCLYVSPNRDVVVVWFSSRADFCLPSYARKIAVEVFGTEGMAEKNK